MPFGPFALTWSTPKPPLTALPSGITRTFISTPSGPLELLSAIPPFATTNESPIIFAHGGFGCAAVWLEYMSYFSGRGIPCYAISYRGHGSSWNPGFWGLVYGTSRDALGGDLVAGIKEVEWLEKERTGVEGGVVLIGHSSGGGLSQLVLSKGDVRLRGLGLIASIPCFGSTGVYLNWFKLDPLFNFRMIWHAWHPKSPLSNTHLIKQVFFGSSMPASRVRAFETLLAPYESFLWPMQMLRLFVYVKNIWLNITGWGMLTNGGKGSERLLVMVGTEDKITTKEISFTMAEDYRKALGQLVRDKKIDDVEEERSCGVRFETVEGVGHHLQNDINWEEGAGKILRWYEQL